MGLPDVRYPTARRSRRISISASGSSSTRASGRFACCAASPTPLADPRARQIDCVLVRESTEGLFAARTLTDRDGDAAVRDTMLHHARATCERLFAFAFTLARRAGRRAGRAA